MGALTMLEATRRPVVNDYAAALGEYLSGAGEFTLGRAYEVGRRAAGSGMSLLEFAGLHHAALRQLSAAPGAQVEEVLTRGEQFFAESLAPFQMTLRAHQDNVRLLGLSEALSRQHGDLALARTQLKALLDATARVIYLKDPQGRFLFVNEPFERAFGVTASQLVGKTGHDFLLDANVAVLQRHDAQVLARQVPGEFEESYLLADGPHTFLALKFPLVDVSGEAHAVCTIACDISERERADEVLRSARQSSAHADRELDAFSHSVAHDLTAPLRSIDGFSQALLEDCGEALGEQGKSHLAKVRQAAQRMAVLIESLLSLARLSLAALEPGELDLSELARQVAAELGRAEPGRQVSFEIQPDLRARADGPLFGAVLRNLLGNSWKFTRQREHAEIKVGQRSQHGLNVYFVQDNGAGFDMAHSGKLFNVFETLHSRRDYEGTGVGLATVQRIVNRHGGRVWAEAAIDLGATFYFTLGQAEHRA